MASRSLMDSALINTAKVTHLTADTLTVSNSQVSSTGSLSTPEITKVNELIPEFVKGLNTVTHSSNYLSEISVMMSTLQLTNPYINSKPYRPVGLYLLLKRSISSNSGPECPGILHSEMFIQNVLTLNSFVASDGANVIFTPVSSSFSFFDENLHAALNLMDKALVAERQLGLRPSSGFGVHTSFSNDQLTIAQDSYVSKQYVNTNSFILTKATLGSLAASTKASLKDVRSTFGVDYSNFKTYTAAMQQTLGATVTVTGSANNNVQNIGYITPILNSLFAIHSCTAIIGQLIAANNPPPIVNLQNGKVVSTGQNVAGWTASEGANWTKLINAGVIEAEYYYITELRDFLNEYMPCNDTFVPYYVQALEADAKAKLLAEYSIDFSDTDYNSSDQKVEGYTVSIPVSSPAHTPLTKSFSK